MKKQKFLTILAAVMMVIFAAGSVSADLIGFWNFDEGKSDIGAGGIKDLAVEDGSHDGTLVGGTFSTDVPAVLGGGRSLDLTSGDSYVVIDSFLGGAADNDFNTGGALTVSVWVKGWPSVDWNPFVSKRGESGQGWQIRKRGNTNNPTLTLRGPSGGDDPTTGLDVGPNPGWTHVAGTYDGAVRKFYVNGVETHSLAGTGNIATTTHYVVFGARDNGGSGSNIGNISHIMLDDIGIWNNALSAEEIADLANGISPLASIRAEIIYPVFGEVVPAGDVTLEWNNYADPCGAPVTVDVAWGTDPNRYNGNYTQAVSNGDVTSVTISPTEPGIYYWYVDTIIGGADPCTVEGKVYMFTNDGPIVSVNAGPDTVTWIGNPVGLVADVNDDGGSPLSYSWTIDSLPTGVTAEFDPDEVSDVTTVTFTMEPGYPVPEMISVDVTLTVTDAINDPVSDTMNIEVYPDECIAARIGMGLDNPADFDKNCLINPEDLAVMAEKWLNDDKNLDQAVPNPGNNWAGNIFSVSFYRGANEKVLLADDEAAGFGDWLTTGWANIECGWDPDGNDETADTITSTGGDTASFYFHDTRNGGGYNSDQDAMAEGTNAEMMEGHGNGTEVNGAGDTTPSFDVRFKIELADITFAAYDVVFYIGTQEAQQGNGSGKYSFNGGPEQDFQIRTGSIAGDKFRFDGTFEQVNNGDGVGNYILIENVTGSSFTYEMYGNGFNHIGLSGFQVREIDPNAPVVSAGDSMITWLGEPVTLTGSIDGTSSNWDMEDTTFAWEFDAMGGLVVAVEDSETLSPTVTVTRETPYWWDIPIPDPSFEDVNVGEDGQRKWFGHGLSTPWCYPDQDDTAPLDYYSIMYRWNPQLIQEGGWTGGGGMLGEVPDGVNCVALGTKLYTGTPANRPDAALHDAGLAQLLDTTYDPRGTYEFTTYIGHSGLSYSNYYGYKVELLAGGSVVPTNTYTDKVVGGTVIGSVESTDPIDPNTWELVTLTVDPNPGNTDLAGEPLQIRITSLRDPADPTASRYIIVDDVKLKTDAPKALEPVIASLTVTEGATGNSITSSAIIDVYENPCEAAVAADPAMEFDPSDLNEDCITSLKDFVDLAAVWLLDYALTEAEAKP